MSVVLSCGFVESFSYLLEASHPSLHREWERLVRNRASAR